PNPEGARVRAGANRGDRAADSGRDGRGGRTATDALQWWGLRRIGGNSRRGRVVASVINEPIVVRLTQPVRNMPIGTELGYRDVADAIAALGSAHYFEVVRTQDGDPIPPLTPEEIEEAQRAARNRAKSRRLIIGAHLDPVIQGPDKVVVGTASGTKQVDVSTLGGDV